MYEDMRFLRNSEVEACSARDQALRRLHHAAVVLDDEVVSEVSDRHVFADGESGHFSALSVSIELDVAGASDAGGGDGLLNDGDFFRFFAKGDDVTRANLEAGDIDFAAIHEDVAVVDELASCGDGSTVTGTEDEVVEAAFEELNEAETGINFAVDSGFHIDTHLAFADTVVETNFLFFVEVFAIFRGFTTMIGTVLPRGVNTMVSGFTGEARKRCTETTNNFDAGTGHTHGWNFSLNNTICFKSARELTCEQDPFAFYAHKNRSKAQSKLLSFV